MVSTKVIPVTKDDSFEEIFDLFQNSLAKDVVLVLPKKGKLFSHKSHFAILAREAEKLDKKISILCENPDLNALAHEHGFTLMGPAARATSADFHAVPPLDSAIHDEDSDAYDRNSRVAIPSDEVVSDHGEDDEAEEDIEKQAGMHVVQDDELKEELGGEGEEHYHEKVKEPSEEELQEVQEDEKPAKEEDAEFVIASDQPGHRVYRIVTAAKRGLDAVVTPAKNERTVKVSKFIDKPVRLGVNTEPAPAPSDAMGRILQSIMKKTPQQEERTDEIVEEPVPAIMPKDKADTLESVWQTENADDKNAWARSVKKDGGHFWNKIHLPKFLSRKARPDEPPESAIPVVPAGPASRSRLSKKLVFGLLAASVIVLGAVVYVSTGSASVTLRPEEKKVDTVLKVEASDTYADVDTVFKKIPGQTFLVEKTVTREFDATGEKEVAAKARGKMTVYNNYGTAPQTLIATTRFESDKGLIFRTLNTITVPGTKVENGKVIAGHTDVEVIADKPGSEYNIPAGKFGIIAFKERGDMDRYDKFYGGTFAPMAGGAVGLSKVVTEADLAKAKETVITELKAQITADLNAQTGGLEIANTSSISMSTVESTARAEQASEKFTVTASGKVKTVAFKKEDLHLLIVKYFEKTDNLVALPEKLDISYGDASYSEEKNTLTFNVALSGHVYAFVDQEQIINDLLGKSEEELREYLKSAPGIVSAKVVLAPFWVTHMPKNRDKVKVEIAY